MGVETLQLQAGEAIVNTALLTRFRASDGQEYYLVGVVPPGHRGVPVEQVHGVSDPLVCVLIFVASVAAVSACFRREILREFKKWRSKNAEVAKNVDTDVDRNGLKI